MYTCTFILKPVSLYTCTNGHSCLCKILYILYYYLKILYYIYRFIHIINNIIKKPLFPEKHGKKIMALSTRGAPSFFEVYVAKMQDSCHHSEEIELLCVIKADLFHGYAHPIKIPHIIQLRVFQRSYFQLLKKHTTKKSWS